MAALVLEALKGWKELLSMKPHRTERTTQMDRELFASRTYVGVRDKSDRSLEGGGHVVGERVAPAQRLGEVELGEEVIATRGEPLLECAHRRLERPRIVLLEPATEKAVGENLSGARICMVVRERALRSRDREVTLLWMKRIRV